MTFKTFMWALFGSFGLPWLVLLVIPFAKMSSLEPVHFTEEADGRAEVYEPRRSGRIADGAQVYGANGCYVCHSQLIRPSFAGSDLARKGWAGFQKEVGGVPFDSRRETTPYDYVGESFAQIGIMRLGPDLSNVGTRIEEHLKTDNTPATTPEEWVYFHLYDPQGKKDTYKSTCPSMRHHFDKIPAYGQGSKDAIPGLGEEDEQVVPSDEIRALASYLLSLKRDDQVPSAINYARDKKGAN